MKGVKTHVDVDQVQFVQYLIIDHNVLVQAVLLETPTYCAA